MNNEFKRTRVTLDGLHSLDIAVNEKAKTVVAELVVDEESIFIYAEKFETPCNYLRTAIKKSIAYLNGDSPQTDSVQKNKTGKNCICLNMNGYVI